MDAEAATATYEDGMLIVELPLRRRAARAPCRSTPAATAATSDRRRRRRRSRQSRRRCRGTLPVLPLRDTVTFPDTLTPLAVGQERSVQLVNDVLAGDRMLVMVASRDPEIEAPGPEQLYDVGVAGTVARMMKVPDGSLRVLVHGGQRVRIEELDGDRPLPGRARGRAARRRRARARSWRRSPRNVQQTFSRIVEQVPYLPEELQMAVANLEDPSALCHLIAGALRIRTEERQALLEEVDVAKRLRRLSEILARELEVVAISTRIQSQVQSELDQTQREYVLRQQLKAIQEELGERDPGRGRDRRAARAARRGASCPRTSASRPTASSRGWRSCRRPPPSTA